MFNGLDIGHRKIQSFCYVRHLPNVGRYLPGHHVFSFFLPPWRCKNRAQKLMTSWIINFCTHSRLPIGRLSSNTVILSCFCGKIRTLQCGQDFSFSIKSTQFLIISSPGSYCVIWISAEYTYALIMIVLFTIHWTEKQVSTFKIATMFGQKEVTSIIRSNYAKKKLENCNRISWMYLLSENRASFSTKSSGQKVAKQKIDIK